MNKYEEMFPWYYMYSNICDISIYFRHGPKHTISPSNVNYRANIHALLVEGCTHILVSACCGSLVEEAKPGHFVVLDQFIDRLASSK